MFRFVADFLSEVVFGTGLKWVVLGGLIVLLALAFLWEVVMAPVNWVLNTIGRGDRYDASTEWEEESQTRRSAGSRERRAARTDARRAALRAKYADAPD